MFSASISATEFRHNDSSVIEIFSFLFFKFRLSILSKHLSLLVYVKLISTELILLIYTYKSFASGKK